MLLCVRMCAEVVTAGSYRVNLVDVMSSHLVKSSLDVESQCVCVCAARIFLAMMFWLWGLEGLY